MHEYCTTHYLSKSCPSFNPFNPGSDIINQTHHQSSIINPLASSHVFHTLVLLKPFKAMRTRRTYLVLLTFILSLAVVSCEREVLDTRPLIVKLNDLPGVTATSMEPVLGFPEQYLLEITQPLDHNNPNGQSFTQKAYLHHRGEDLPMVFGPAGYGISESSRQELGEILGANMLIVAHRYFVDAEPDPLRSDWDWDFLNISQAAADHHHIVEMFKKIYTETWVSSGASKSGQTALFHRRFYPDDVDATVAYVAPIVFGTHDQRFIPFMENVGTSECREAQNNFERRLLVERDSLIPLFVNWFADNGSAFSLDPEEAFEYAVLEYHYAFWQSHNTPCDSIPGDAATLVEVFSHLTQVLWLNSFSDFYMDYYTPYYFQALKESGYIAYITSHISDLLEIATDPGADFFVAADVTTGYDPSVMQDIVQWLSTEGNNIVYIYGEYDPWSAAMFEPGEGTNALRVIQPGEDHGVKIRDLDEQERVLDSLEVWLGLASFTPN
ncbi:S28 family serine protease [Bacteroidota bacterium]